MRMMDTDIIVDILREHPPSVQWLRSLVELPTVSGFTVLELYSGCSNKAQVQRVNRLIRNMPVVWPTENELQKALESYASHRLSHSLGVLDALRGICAAERGWILCTFNVKHFQSLPGLIIEQPYSR